MVRNNQAFNFNTFTLTDIKSITLNIEAIHDHQVITKSYIDQFRQVNEQAGRGLGNDFYKESSDLIKHNPNTNFNDNKLPTLDFQPSPSVIVNRSDRNPSSDNKLANEK